MGDLDEINWHLIPTNEHMAMQYAFCKDSLILLDWTKQDEKHILSYMSYLGLAVIREPIGYQPCFKLSDKGMRLVAECFVGG